MLLDELPIKTCTQGAKAHARAALSAFARGLSNALLLAGTRAPAIVFSIVFANEVDPCDGRMRECGDMRITNLFSRLGLVVR